MSLKTRQQDRSKLYNETIEHILVPVFPAQLVGVVIEYWGNSMPEPLPRRVALEKREAYCNEKPRILFDALINYIIGAQDDLMHASPEKRLTFPWKKFKGLSPWTVEAAMSHYGLTYEEGELWL